VCTEVVAKHRTHFAELHAELIEAVDAPHEALHDGAVLIQRQELAGLIRGEAREQQDVGRAVA
jgi:hypothetical protein